MILWLYASGQLSLYIHPRYHLFTAAMAVIAVFAVVAGLGYSSRGQSAADGHEHDHDHDDAPPSTGSRWAFWASSVLSVVALAGLVVIPPATLGSVTVDNRAINQSGLGDTAQAFDQARSGDTDVFAAFTVREWAGLLRQTVDPGFYRGKPVDVVGFVAADPAEDDIFYVTRFVVSCCSVDAQPVGIPVKLQGWQQQWSEESWVRLTGEFSPHQEPGSAHPLVVEIGSIEPAEAPNEPYLF